MAVLWMCRGTQHFMIGKTLISEMVANSIDLHDGCQHLHCRIIFAVVQILFDQAIELGAKVGQPFVDSHSGLPCDGGMHESQ